MKDLKRLSGNEELVLYSLVKYPSLFDSDICGIIDMRKSTFSSIKKRLRERGYYSNVRVPMFRCIGCELFMVSYGLLNRATTIERRMAVARNLLEEFNEFFYIISESNQAVNLAVSKNYTEYDKDVQRFTQVYMENNFLTERGFTYVAFPFETSTMFDFFNFAPLLNRFFGLGIDEVRDVDDISNCKICEPKEVVITDMTTVERRVYLGLIQYPDFPDKIVAKKVSASRNTVTKLKRKFLDEKLIVLKRLPNFSLLGSKLLVFTHVTFNPKTTISDRRKAIENAEKILTPILFVSKNLEGVLLTLYKDFEDYQRGYGDVLGFYMENDYIKEEPINLLLSIPQMTTIKNHVYAPLVEKMLGLNVLNQKKPKEAKKP